MSFLQNIRKFLRQSIILRKFVAYYVVPSGYFDKKVLSMEIASHFKKRIEIVLSCPDNKKIFRVSNSGLVYRGKQTMHNGLKINLGSYYGPEVAQQLFLNKGVHEPQEEYVFQEVLKGIPNGATMIELGSFWSFYSMWFNSAVSGSKNYMVEPESFNLGCGKRNFKLNKLKGDFTQAFVGKSSSIIEGIATIGIDDFCKEKQIDFLDILHSDIQGFELLMLEGARKFLIDKKIGYLFISTHTNELHSSCIHFLENLDYQIVCEYNLDESFSEDGLIVAKSRVYEGITEIEISKRSNA